MKPTTTTRQATKRYQSGQASKPTPQVSPGPFPYPPEIEAQRATYDRVAAAFSELFDLHFRDDVESLLQIESHLIVPETDFVALILQHMETLCAEVQWTDRRVMSWLYPHLRLIVDTQEAELQTKGKIARERQSAQSNEQAQKGTLNES